VPGSGTRSPCHTDRVERLSAAVVIITYERPEVLSDTLDCWRGVLPGPDQFLVVDASPNAADRRSSVLAEFSDLFSAPGSDYVVANQASTTTQRNLGLNRVHTDVVLFTDDEARPEADYVSKIMDVYERDTTGVVGGVSGSERDEETMVARAKRRLQDSGRLFARRFAGDRGRSSRALPPDVARLPVVVVRGLHGAKMSFRSDLAKRLAFDAHMRRYGYCEDLDISVRATETHLLVQRRDAFILHDEAAEGRVPSEAAFLVSWVNPAYLTEKLSVSTPNRRPLRRLLVIEEAKELLRPSVIWHRRLRDAALDRFALVRRMLGYLEQSPSDELAWRFDLLQEYIFEVPSPSDGSRLDHFDRWLLARRLDRLAARATG
jgi:GT2 family glycosyltransferase